MTDQDLVEKLRLSKGINFFTQEPIFDEVKVAAADRIEQLVAIKEALTKERNEAWKRAAHSEKMWGKSEVKLAECEARLGKAVEAAEQRGYANAMEAERKLHEDRVEALEAKLAKAVDTLEDIVKDCEAVYPPSHGAIKYFARTTLAEIKGESHD